VATIYIDDDLKSTIFHVLFRFILS